MLACNWITVDVYLRCQLTFIGGGAGAICIGVAAGEIHAALQLTGIATQHWQEVTDGVLVMGRAAMKAMNRAVRKATPRQSA